jgi:hypothetical protein
MKPSKLSPWFWTLAVFLLLAALIVALQFIDIEPWTMQEAIRSKVNG